MVLRASTERQQYHGSMDPSTCWSGGQRARRCTGEASGGGRGGHGGPRVHQGGQPLPPNEKDDGGPFQCVQRVDPEPCPQGAQVPPPAGWKAPQGARQGTQGVGRALLHISSCQVTQLRPPPCADRPGPQQQVLVVRQRRETDAPSPLYPV